MTQRHDGTETNYDKIVVFFSRNPHPSLNPWRKTAQRPVCLQITDIWVLLTEDDKFGVTAMPKKMLYLWFSQFRSLPL